MSPTWRDLLYLLYENVFPLSLPLLSITALHSASCVISLTVVIYYLYDFRLPHQTVNPMQAQDLSVLFTVVFLTPGPGPATYGQ